MKEIYEKMQIDIEIMSVLDVITTSSDVEGTDPTESEEHEKASLIRVAINICKNTVTHWSRNSVDISTLPLTSEQVHNDILRQVLELPSELKVPVYLHYYAGYSSKEIGKLLGIADSSVRSRIRKAKKILEKVL